MGEVEFGPLENSAETCYPKPMNPEEPKPAPAQPPATPAAQPDPDKTVKLNPKDLPKAP